MTEKFDQDKLKEIIESNDGLTYTTGPQWIVSDVNEEVRSGGAIAMLGIEANEETFRNLADIAKKNEKASIVMLLTPEEVDVIIQKLVDCRRGVNTKNVKSGNLFGELVDRVFGKTPTAKKPT